MSDLVIAVGGTGQHVALATSRLINLRALPPMQVMIIDADSQGPLSQEMRTFGRTLKVDGVAEPLPHPMVGGDRIYPPFNLAENQNATFESLLLQNTTDVRSKMLFDLFFTPQESQTNVAQGMYGQPSVGSTVFAFSQAGPMRKLLEGTATADRIYVTGSFIGGTGAGLVHQLVRQLRDIHGDKKKIFGIFLLPWLDTQSSSAGTITTAGIDANFRHGCEYLWDETRHSLTATLLLGVPTGQNLRYVKTVIVNSETTGETASFLHLAAANGLLALEERVVKDGPGNVYGMAHATEHEEALVTRQPWAGELTLVQRAHAATTTERLLHALATQDDDVKGGFGLFGAKHIPGYHESLEDYARLAGMKPAVFVDLVGRFYEIHRRQISYCLRWLNALVPLPPLDAATESMWKDGAAVVATLRDPKRLRRRFTPPPPDPSGKSYTAEQLARHLAQSVVNTLSPVH